MSDYILLSALADELGMWKSNLRKYILSNGISFQKIRTPETRNQLALALTENDANLVRQLREQGGFGTKKPIPSDKNGDGFFYIIQIVPDLDPLRVKLGFSSNVEGRLQAHRTAAPTAKLAKSWPCRRSWEIAAMASITKDGCELIANEVYICKDVDKLTSNGDKFFEIMPEVNF